MAGVEITVSGPAFDGRAPEALRRIENEAIQRVGDLAADEVRGVLSRNVKHPTGFYQGHIITNLATGSLIVSDSNVIYGPWLEGTSKRNETTRFKGYSAFRLTRQGLSSSGKVQGVLQEVVHEHLGELT